MNLLGTAVRHSTFGEGTILDQSGNYIVVGFAEGKKEFLYPNVFSKHITAVDPQMAALIKADVVQYEASEATVLENERQQRIATQNARRETMQAAAAAVKSRSKKKPAKPAPKPPEEPVQS